MVRWRNGISFKLKKLRLDFVFFFYCMYIAYFVILYRDQQMHNYFTHYHTATSFDTVILRQSVINTLPSYTSISNAAVGNTVYN